MPIPGFQAAIRRRILHRGGCAKFLRDGKILNVSSSGVRFTTERTLSVGQTVEVTVEWPALIDNKCLMKLVIEGWVARSDSNSAAVKIEHYEFAPAPPVIGDGCNPFLSAPEAFNPNRGLGTFRPITPFDRAQ